MSFLGSIGHLMTGSGLQEFLEVVYASNSVSHMLGGKAISRAVRGHFLVDAALNTMLIADLYNVQLPTNEEKPPEVHSEQDQHPGVPCGVTNFGEQPTGVPSGTTTNDQHDLHCDVAIEEEQIPEINCDAAHVEQQPPEEVHGVASGGGGTILLKFSFLVAQT